MSLCVGSPEKIGEAPEAEQQRNGAEARDQAGRLGEVHFVIPTTHEGYIQAIDGDGLMEVAAENDLVLRLRLRPGHFVARDAPLADVWNGNGHFVEKLSVDDLTTQMNERIITDIRRTPRQDVECAIEELVEVAVRSLSPGINDPFTAVNCIDRLGASLGRLAERKLPVAYRCDKEGKLRVIAHPVVFAEALDAAFDQIRQYGRRSVSVTVRLLEALGSIAAHIHRVDDRIAVKVHAEMIARHAESLSEEHDRQAVTMRLERVKRLLEAGEATQ